MALGWLLEHAAHALSAEESGRTASEHRYHGKHFRDAAGKVGLTAEKGANGWSSVTVPDDTLTRYGTELELIRSSLAELDLETLRVYRNRTGEVATCSCPQPRRIRVSESVLALGPISCSVCGAAFEVR